MRNPETLRRIGRRLLAALLLLAAVAMCLFPAWITVAGVKNRELRETRVELTEKVDKAKDAILGSDLIGSEVFKDVGLKLSRTNIKRAALQTKSFLERCLDGKLSPLELLQSAPYLSAACRTGYKLTEVPETAKLFKLAGLEKQYSDFSEQDTLLRAGAWAFGGYILLFALLLAAAAVDLVRILRGKKRGFGTLFLILQLLLTVCFFLLKVGGSHVIGESELPDRVYLQMTVAPLFSVLLTIASFVFYSRRESEEPETAEPKTNWYAAAPDEYTEMEEEKPVRRSLLWPILLTALITAAATIAVMLFVVPKLKPALEEADGKTEAVETLSSEIAASSLNKVAVGKYHVLRALDDKTVVSGGANTYLQLETGDWSDVVAVSAGSLHSVGLRSNGTAVAAGRNFYGQCEVSGWENLIAVAAGENFSVGLRADGTVIATNEEKLHLDGSDDWKNIKEIAAGEYHVAGLREDGTVVAAGTNSHGECDVSDWEDVTGIAAGGALTLGLRSDGTVLYAGASDFGLPEVSEWTDVVSLAAGNRHVVGLRSDGTAVAKGANSYGQCEVSDWTELVAVYAYGNNTLGLCKDGTLLYAGAAEDISKTVSDWNSESTK